MAKKPLFYKIYFSVIAVFLVLLAAGLCLLYSWLNAYEQARPETVMENIHTNYIQKGNLYTLKEKGGLQISPYETKESLDTAFSEWIKNKQLKWQSAAAKLGEQSRAYTVTADGEPLLTIRLQQQKTGGRLGIKPYAPAEITLAPSLYKTVTVTAPANVELNINGIEVKAEKPAEEAIPEAVRQKAGDAALAAPHTYQLKYFLSTAPNITAKGSAPLEITGENGVYSVRQTLDAGAEKQMQDFALAAAHTYAAYMQNDLPLTKVAAYVDTDTAFYKNIRTSSVAFAWQHNNYGFENDRCGTVYAYSDRFYRCRVSFTQVLYLGSKTYKDAFDQYLYLSKTTNGWKVIDMQQYSEALQ